ncbi:hypothetical protein cypCar_00010531 [Cyprinus carpio]|nr:hypothetical protein cypCar_00010531 [Cyprinus carpio]
MENLDELEHPLLGDSSPINSSETGTSGSGLFRSILMRNEEDKRLPPLDWRNYCRSTDIQQQQLLDPCSLPSTLETLYPPTSIWAAADSLGIHSKEYLETTFVDIGPGSPLERKLLAETRDIHSVSYSMEDGDDLLPDFETNKASAQGDFQGASAASRQALWLSILSIVFGIITYICAIAALISYLSGKPP